MKNPLRIGIDLDNTLIHYDRAFRDAARERGLALEPPGRFESSTGIGVRGQVGARELALLPKDAADEKNAILEVRAGTGGGADQMARFIQGVVAKHKLMKQSMVAMFGQIMPAPLQMPPMRTVFPPSFNSTAICLGRLSLVMMASAA